MFIWSSVDLGISLFVLNCDVGGDAQTLFGLVVAIWWIFKEYQSSNLESDHLLEWFALEIWGGSEEFCQVGGVQLSLGIFEWVNEIQILLVSFQSLGDVVRGDVGGLHILEVVDVEELEDLIEHSSSDWDGDLNNNKTTSPSETTEALLRVSIALTPSAETTTGVLSSEGMTLRLVVSMISICYYYWSQTTHTHIGCPHLADQYLPYQC